MADITNCANIDCPADFLRLSDGKLFICPQNDFCFAWLCEVCMKRFTIDWQDTTPVAVPVRCK
jgi:hypothetical protein